MTDWNTFGAATIHNIVASHDFARYDDADLTALLVRCQKSNWTLRRDFVAEQIKDCIEILKSELARRRQEAAQRIQQAADVERHTQTMALEAKNAEELRQVVDNISNQIGTANGQIATLNKHAASVDGHVQTIDDRLNRNESGAKWTNLIAYVGLVIAALALARDVFDWHWPRQPHARQAPPIARTSSAAVVVANTNLSPAVASVTSTPSVSATNAATATNVLAATKNALPLDPVLTNRPITNSSLGVPATSTNGH